MQHDPYLRPKDLAILGYTDFSLIDETESSSLYRALAPDEQPFLIKIPASEQQSASLSRQFEHELEIASKLNPEFVVKPLRIERNAGWVALILEDCAYLPLTKLMQQQLGLGSFVRIALGIASALVEVHSAGLVHKDIKPANILTRDDGRVKLAGFGIASKLSRERQAPGPPEVIAGTLAYMAPEQTGRMDRSIDTRSDLYALGVTFYQMLTGQLPFNASDPMEWVHCHIALAPTPPCERVTTIPDPLSDIVMKLMAKTPEDRYQTAEGLKADLERCAAEWNARGRIEPFQLGARDAPGHLQIPEKLYGRETEVATLLAAFDRVVASGRPELVLVSGYSGVGKSAVVNELHKMLVPPRALFAGGKFDQYKPGVPYSILAQCLEALIRPILSKSQVELDVWRNALLGALETNGQLVVDLVPELQLIIGEQPPVPTLTPQLAEARFKLVLRRFIGVFAQPEHPLALFLDDLQWLDVATLDVMEDWLTQEDIRHLLLIGAYRDNEVDLDHPLMRKLETIRRAGAAVQEIGLAPLNLGSLRHLFADCLYCSAEQASPLAQQIHAKTAGNPLFAIQFAKMLYSEKLIYFKLDEQEWRWDINEIEKQRMTENVVELLVSSIKKYPENVQETLKFAACIGSDFDLRTLSIVRSKDLITISREMDAPIGDGLVYPASEPLRLITENMTDEKMESSANARITYKFQHDRIQQAAYSLIPEESRGVIHYQIGKHILLNSEAEDIDNNLFDIVGHLNQGIELIQDEKEKYELAEMNLKSGIKAKNSTAYHQATEFLIYGIRLLPGDAWDKNYPLTFELYKHRAQALFLIGNIEQSEEDIDLLLDKSVDRYDKAEVYLIAIAHFAQLGEYKKSLEVGIECLRLFDYSLPDISTPEKSRAAMEAAVSKFQGLMDNRSFSDLYKARDIQDRDKSYLIRILSDLSDATYISLPPMFPYVIFDIVNLSIAYGYNNYSAVGFCWFPVITALVLDDYNLGYESGQLSLALNERYDNQQIKSQTIFISSIFTIHWMFHNKEVLKLLHKAVKAGIENGEYRFSGYARVMIPKTILDIGDTIARAREENEKSLVFLKKNNSIFADEVEFFREFLNNLSNANEYKTNFDCAGFSEKKYLDKWQEVSFGHGLGYYVSYKSQNLFLFEQYEEAYAVGSARKDWLQFIATLFEETMCVFYHALSAFAIVANCDKKKKQSVLQVIKESTEKFSRWSDQCPENFEHKYLIIQAEQARIDGKFVQAMDLYDKAIESARKNDYVNNVALANELAAKFYLANGKEKIAKLYFMEARHHYYRWGALAKVAHLEEKYPQFCEMQIEKDISTSGENLITSTTISSEKLALDYESIFKSMQAISGEVVLPVLLEKLMAIIIQNAGAQRGFFILNREGNLTIEITASDNPQVISKVDSLGLDEATALCVRIVNYVERTCKSVMLNDATLEGDYAADRYIQDNGIKSVLCSPILNQGRLIGIIYLENNLSAGAFTENHIEILNILTSQAAISIENASLYEGLKERMEGTAALLRINQMSEASNQEIMEYALEEAIHLTASAIGYIGFVNEEETSMSVQAWSLNVMPECGIAEAPIDFSLATGGLWAEAIRQRRPVVTNDYNAPNEWKRGTPEGHLSLTRHMNLPVIVDGKIVLVAGVGNKKTAYSETDVQQLMLVMEGMWRLTERKRTSDELLLTSERLQLATHVAKVGVWDWDVVNNELQMDESMYQLYGIRSEDFGGAYDTWARTLYPEDRAYAEGEIQAALRGEHEYEPEFRIVRPDGSVRHIKANSKTIMDQEGKPLRMIGTNIDITERKQAEKELLRYKEHLEETVQERTAELLVARDAAEAANKAKSMFLANMSHELRTPLNAILGFSSLMCNEPVTDSGQREKLDIIKRSGEHLLTLINDVLEMAKIEAGRIQLEIAPFDLGGMVRDVVDMMRLRAEEKGLRLLLDQSSEFPRYIKGDEGRLRQILMNLVGNAVKFTSEGGVTIRLGVKDNERQHLIVEVEDSGPGISPDDQQRVFQPFVQLVRSDSYKGTGLGLAITNHFVKMMGGKIDIESTQGKGSVFRVALPLELSAESEIAAGSEQISGGEICGLVPGQTAWRILIAEDEYDNQKLLQSLMSAIGLETKVAADGEEAVKIFQAWQPHLIWMDRRMPVMDGVEAARRIRRLPGGREVPIVAVTASVFKEQQQELSTAGMDGLVRKPYRFSEIYDCMARLLGVKYVYREAKPKMEAVTVLTPAMLAALSEGYRQRLYDAVASLDNDKISAVIEELDETEPDLAIILKRLAVNFDYPAILEALEADPS
ncbi:MAG: AAA family ATPase [Candidatus Thiodiazotropha sp.]